MQLLGPFRKSSVYFVLCRKGPICCNSFNESKRFFKKGTGMYFRWSLTLRCLCICNSTQICTLRNETKYLCWRACASDTWQHYDVTAGKYMYLFTVKTNYITPLSGQIGYFCWGDELTISVFRTNLKAHRSLIIAPCFKIEFQILNSWNLAKHYNVEK